MSRVEADGLREEYQARAESFVDLVLERQMLQEDLVTARTENDTLRARVAELEAERDGWRENADVALNAWERASEREAQHLARIAELEADVSAAAGELLVEIPEPGSVVARLLLANTAMRRQRDALAGDRVRDAAAMDARMQEREAQHLADIKALRDRLFCREFEVMCSNNCPPKCHCVDCRIYERLAHYDDAKADAPVCHSCEKPSPTTAFDADAGRPMCAACRGVEHADTEGGAR